MEEIMLTCAEVAKRCNVKIATVWSWVRSGKIRAIRYGHRTVRIPETALSDFQRRAAQ